MALAALSSLAWAPLYPIVVLARLLLRLLLVLATPFLLVGSVILYICLLPVRLLAKLEPLYTFLGVACLIGLLAGVVLHFISSSLFDLLGIGPDKDGGSLSGGRYLRGEPSTVSGRRKFRKPSDRLLLRPNPGGAKGIPETTWPRYIYPADRIGRDPSLLSNDVGLFSTAIIEEGDSSES